MAKSADLGAKRLISLAPDNWVRWITQIQNLTVGEIINAEFQWIGRESYVLIPVETPEDGKFLVLNELQLRYNSQRYRISSRHYEVGYGSITRIALVSRDST